MNGFELKKNHIHLWQLNWPENGKIFMEQANLWLSYQEKIQAGNYKIPDDKIRFCLGRIMLRYLSGNYTKCDGKTLEIITNDYGKPMWRDLADKLYFNISHSGDWVLVAFSSGREVGIDTQKINYRPKFNFTNIAKHYFHKNEIHEINSLPENKQESKFYDIWTFKEAAIKALGTGLHGKLEKFSVLPLPNTNKTSLINTKEWFPEVEYLTLAKLHLDDKHFAALAVHGNANIENILQRDFVWGP